MPDHQLPDRSVGTAARRSCSTTGENLARDFGDELHSAFPRVAGKPLLLFRKALLVGACVSRPRCIAIGVVGGVRQAFKAITDLAGTEFLGGTGRVGAPPHGAGSPRV